MRAIIEIGEDENRALKNLARLRGVSRAHMVREAIDRYLQVVAPENAESAFGLWRDKGLDGLAYERRLRRDWPA
jgi:predicted transcriptional regulator